MKRCFVNAVIGAAFMTLGLGWGVCSEVQAQDVKIAFSVSRLDDPWFHEVVDGVQKACNELKIKCDVVDAGNNKQKQSADVRKMIDDKYDAILVSAVDPFAFSHLFADAEDKGIPVGSIAQTVLHSNLYYGIDEFAFGTAIGKQAGEWAQKNLKCQGKTLLLTQDKIVVNQARGDGVVYGLHQLCPDMQIVARYYADEPLRGMMMTDIALARNPDLNMIVATNDGGGIGGFIMMAANNFLDDHHAVFSGDASKEVLHLMSLPRSVYRGTVDLEPSRGGYESVKILYDMVENDVPFEPVLKQFPYVAVSQEDVKHSRFQNLLNN